MKLPVLLVLAIAAASPAHADESITTFLERRVPQELASEGVLLARHGLTLRVEQVGDKLIVSLVDDVTARTSASTKVDVVPPDREAAVATVTHVVAELVVQITGRPTVAPVPPPVAPPQPDPREREVAEGRFQRLALRVDAEVVIGASSIPGFPTGKKGETTPATPVTTANRRWQVVLGAYEPVAPRTFYEMTGRRDLLDMMDRGHRWSRRFLIASGLSFAGTITMGIVYSKTNDTRDRNIAYIGLGAGIVAAILGIANDALSNDHMVTELEARRIVDDYNRKLRTKLGLPLAIAPYAGNGAGVIAAGRF